VALERKFMSLSILVRNLAKRREAIADLEEVRKAVFGDVGDEPNVYADYDRCVELAAKMRRALDTLSVT
jgi:hypothetical protein